MVMSLLTAVNVTNIKMCSFILLYGSNLSYIYLLNILTEVLNTLNLKACTEKLLFKLLLHLNIQFLSPELLLFFP